MTLERGVCRHCKCTDAKACPGGCTWADLQHTLCSRCASMIIGELTHAVRLLMPAFETLFVECVTPEQVIESLRSHGMRDDTCSLCSRPFLTRGVRELFSNPQSLCSVCRAQYGCDHCGKPAPHTPLCAECEAKVCEHCGCVECVCGT